MSFSLLGRSPSAGTGAAAERWPPRLKGGGAARRQRTRVLLICCKVTMPYRVMRCLAAAGAAVAVMGNEFAPGLRYSRFCDRFVRAHRRLGDPHDLAAAAEIDDCARAVRADLLAAGDAPSARMLAGMKDRLSVPCIPMPDLAQFDLLHDKANFFRLCTDLGVPCPPTTLFADRGALLGAIDTGRISLPAVAKPLAEDGGRGVRLLAPDTARATAGAIPYAPILVQDFVPGEDIGASAFFKGGQLRAFVAHRLAHGVYSTFAAPDIRDHVTRILQFVNAEGIFNFDMRRTDAGSVLFLECNPRIYYKISLTMRAGINFMALAIGKGAVEPSVLPHGRSVRSLGGCVPGLLRPWMMSSRDLASAMHELSDPVSLLREKLRLDWDHEEGSWPQ